MLLDELMPRYEFSGVHRIEVFAPPERALEAVRQVTPDEMPIARLLFALRSLPAHLFGKDGLPADKTVALYDHMARRFVLLAEQPGQEILVGRIGELWKLVGGMSPAFRDADGFAEFGEPGYAKVAASFSAVSRDGLTELCTETRVLTTDPTSRRAFGRYWRVIQPWSGVIRRSWLRAAKRRAESDTCAAVDYESESDEKPRDNGGFWVKRSILPWVSPSVPEQRSSSFSRTGSRRLCPGLKTFGTAGAVVPHITGVLPRLTPLAAAGLTMVKP